MPELKAFSNDTVEWVIAESPEAATQIMVEEMGCTYDDPPEWEECPLDKSFTYHGDGGADEPVTKTFREWIAEKGRGFLATTEY